MVLFVCSCVCVCVFDCSDILVLSRFGEDFVWQRQTKEKMQHLLAIPLVNKTYLFLLGIDLGLLWLQSIRFVYMGLCSFELS